MSNLAVFIFDQIFESMASDNALSELQDADVEVHIISHKSKLTDYKPIKDPATTKIVCINPDYVDWNLETDDYKDIPNLRLIIGGTDNTDWLDTKYLEANELGFIALVNLTSEYSAVAEYAVTIMMSLARNIPAMARANYPADYVQDYINYQAIDLAGKTAGIIGLGNIGGAIAKLCNGLGMNVVYWSRAKKQVDYEYREIDEILKTADVIFPTLKPGNETSTMLPNGKLESIKNMAIVVSVVSDLVDNAYLADRVHDGQLFGFGFGADPNVFNDYSGNVWAIPDYAWATRNNMRQSYDQFTDIILQSIKRLS